MSGPERDVRQQAQRLREAWEQRGRSESRDFYVASHPGWDDAERRAAQARLDVAPYILGLELRLPGLHVLEIGSGVGRLARTFAARALSYTGLDFAPSMLAEARKRCAGLGGTRFLECDGLSLPEAARDRRYGLIFAHAVFIHCSREVIAAWISAAWPALAPGGELRFHLLADYSDPGGLAAPVTADSHAAHAAQLAEVVERPEELALAAPADFMGHAFRWDEAHRFLEQVCAAPFELRRLDLASLGVKLRRPSEDAR